MSINSDNLGEMGAPMLVDLLKSMDYGGYYFFDWAATHHPWLVDVMLPARWLGSYGVVAAFLLAVIFFVAQRRMPAALISLGTLAAGVICVEILRYAIGAHRPANAQRLVDADEMLRSFPAREVFAFTLAGSLLLFAAWPVLPNTALRLLAAAFVVALILWAAVSQLALGLSFVTDVMAGLAGGLAVALVASRFSVQKRQPSAAPQEESQQFADA